MDHSNFSGILSIPAEQYRASAAIGKSDLDYLQPPFTPAHFRAHKDGLMPQKESEAMTIGSITHRALLEPDTMKDAFSVKPEGMSLVTKEGRAWKDEQKGKPILSADVAGNINGMVQAIHRHAEAKRLFVTAKTEQSIFVEHDGLKLKSRVDILPEHGNIIADIKTCESADPDEFAKAIANYSYYRQAYFYLKLCKLAGLEKTNFVFIAVEKTPPYEIGMYILDEEAMDAGRLTIERDLATIRECEARNKWPGRPRGIMAISMPQWFTKQLNAAI
jgi:exodeoxyribonuclease VIII